MEHFPPVLYWLNAAGATATAVVALFLFTRGFPDQTLRWVWLATAILAGLTAPLNAYLARKASRRP